MDNGRPPIRNVHLTRAICLVQLPRTCGPPGRGRGSSSYPSSDRTTPFNSSPSFSSVKLGADALSLHLLSGPVYRRELAKVSCLSAVARQRDAVLDEISGFAGSWISWRSVGAGCRLTRDWTSDLTDNENWWHFCLIVSSHSMERPIHLWSSFGFSRFLRFRRTISFGGSGFFSSFLFLARDWSFDTCSSKEKFPRMNLWKIGIMENGMVLDASERIGTKSMTFGRKNSYKKGFKVFII